MTKLARLSDAELVERLKLYEACKRNIAQAARKMGIAPSSMSVSLAEARRRGLTANSKTVDMEAKLRTKLALATQELAARQRENDTAESIRKEIYALAAMTPDPPRWVSKKTKPGSPGVPMTVWSDWHWGERVTKSEVGGVNEFNRKIAWQRVRKLVEKTIDLCYGHMVKPDYPGIVVALAGDFITGAIHDDLAETNDGTVQQAVLDVTEALIWGISELADKFGAVFCPCVPGNHGRDTGKPRVKRAVFHSYEWNICCTLERHFRGDKRVQFMIPEEPDCLFTVAGHRYFLTHGDRLGTGGGDGIIGCLGPIARGTIKLGRQQAQIGRDFDTMVIGHYHQYVPRSEAIPVIVNGCLIGFNEYANLGLRARYSRPSQALWFTHPEHGVTAQWAIYLEPERKSITRKSDWVTWQQTQRRPRGRQQPPPRRGARAAAPRRRAA
jgi:hypothetical protein